MWPLPANALEPFQSIEAGDPGPDRARVTVMARSTPSFVSSALRVFDLSLGQMLWSRRTIFMALVVGGPVVVAIIVRALDLVSRHALQIQGTPMAGPGVFGLMIWFFYLRFTVPVLAVFYGVGLIADEVDDKTITYLFTRPIPRGAVMVGKFLAYLTCTTMVVLPSVMIVFFLVVPRGGGSLAQAFPALVKDLGILWLGLAVYGALFAFVGAWFKRPLVTGLLFLFGWEPAVLVFPGYLKRFTVSYYLQSLVPHAMPQDGAASLLQSIFRDVPSLTAAFAGLLGIFVVSLFLAVRVVERKEYVLEQ
jgi:ABC-type transport system involved in multi-copper enzyme maturation permease subunit